MTDKKYKFSVDEPRPDVPPPQDFSTLLAGVKAQIPWYANTSLWGGIAGLATVGVAIGVFTMNKGASTEPVVQVKPETEQQIEVRSSQNLPKTPMHIHAATASAWQKNAGYAANEMGEETMPGVASEIADIAHQNIAEDSHLEIRDRANTGKKHQWGIGVKYDTFYVNTATLPIELELKRGGTLYIPAKSVAYGPDEPFVGEFMLLYREFVDQTDLMVSSLFLEAQGSSGKAPMICNGAFEIQLKYNQTALTIKKGLPFLVQFPIVDSDPVFSGFKTRNHEDVWQPMMFSTRTSSTAAETATEKKRMESKRSFGQWIADLLYGRTVRWDTFETTSYVDYGVYSKTRTFEVGSTGYFGSGRTVESGFTNSTNIRISCQDNEKIEPTLYQVFLNSNIVRKYDIRYGVSEVSYSTNDRCMLIAVIENSNFLAILDANNFDKLIKGELNQVDIILRLVPSEVRKIEDLRSIIRNYGDQKQRK
jgi:hypothetical protein